MHSSGVPDWDQGSGVAALDSVALRPLAGDARLDGIVSVSALRSTKLFAFSPRAGEEFHCLGVRIIWQMDRTERFVSDGEEHLCWESGLGLLVR